MSADDGDILLLAGGKVVPLATVVAGNGRPAELAGGGVVIPSVEAVDGGVLQAVVAVNGEGHVLLPRRGVVT